MRYTFFAGAIHLVLRTVFSNSKLRHALAGQRAALVAGHGAKRALVVEPEAGPAATPGGLLLDPVRVEQHDEFLRAACVEACPEKATIFGDRTDPQSLVFEMIGSPRVFRLKEELGTQPSVYYLK